MEPVHHRRASSRLGRVAVAFVLASLLAHTGTAAEGSPRRLPPAGVPAADLAAKLAPEKRAAWNDLAGRIADVRRRLADGRFSDADQLDVEVLLKAVEFAIDGGEWWQPADLDHALWAVAEAEARLAAVARGEHPWRASSGLSVHGFRSAIDGSVQPYGLWIPEGLDRSRPVPLWIWLHGRGERETDLHFLYQRAHKPPEFQPADAVVLLPFGRYCNGWKGPGMVDVFEARDAAGRLQPIDPDRVVLAGFSMGGAGAWQIGARRAGEFCGVHGGAGFVDTRRYTGVDVATLPWYEVRLWATTDVPPVARNLLNLPAIAYSGELDKQRAASEIMVETMAAEGRELPHVIGAGMPHKYDETSKTAITAFLRQAVMEGRRRRPDEVHLATTSLADARIAWVEVLGLGEHFTPARVDAARGGGDRAATITATTTNVTAVVFHDARGVGSVRIDGHDLATPVGTAADELVLARTGLHREGAWCVTPRANLPSLRKRPGLTGPIDDAFTKPFVVVPPVGPGLDPAVDEWVRREFDHFRRRWRDLFRGELPVVTAAAVTDELVRDKNLILFGDPVSNPWIARVLADLPLRWTPDTLTVAGKPYPAARHVPVMIHPNPLVPPTPGLAGRSIVLNSGVTFREAADASNAWQNPKLPDWAVVDISVPPDGHSPGRVVDAGFCDESWRIVSH